MAAGDLISGGIAGQSSDPIMQLINRITQLQDAPLTQGMNDRGSHQDEISALHNYLQKLMGGSDPFGSGVGNNPFPDASQPSYQHAGGGGAGGMSPSEYAHNQIMQKLQEEMTRAQISNLQGATGGRQAALDAAKNVLKIKAPWLMSSLSKDPRNQVY